MAITWDPSDVPVVPAEDLAAAMESLITEGFGLVLLRGRLSSRERAIVEASLYSRLGKEPSRQLAALMRFRAMIEVFTARRLCDVFMEHGHDTIAYAIQASASMRLNATWGFNPQKFARKLIALIEADDIEPTLTPAPLKVA